MRGGVRPQGEGAWAGLVLRVGITIALAWALVLLGSPGPCGAESLGIVVDEFRIENAEAGPAASAAELTARICRDLMQSTDPEVILAGSEAETGFLREHRSYRLGGTIRWETKQVQGTSVAVDLALTSVSTQKKVLSLWEDGLSLPQASARVMDAFTRLRGDVEITSNRDGADVYIHGAFAGQTPLRLSAVPVDVYPVEVRYRGFESSGTLTISAPSQSLEIELPGIRVEDIDIWNPSEGPAISGDELAARLCRELARSCVLPVRLPQAESHESEGDLYAIRGKARWVADRQSGGSKLKLDLALWSERTRQPVLKLETKPLGLSEAAASVAERFQDPRGWWSIRCETRGTEVWIDDRLVGTAPFDSAGLLFDLYEVRLEQSTKITRSESVLFNQTRQENSFDLEDRPIVVYLDTSPSGAEVWVGGRKLGTTPVTLRYPRPVSPTVRFKHGKIRHYRTLSVRPYQTYHTTLDLNEGRVVGDRVLKRQMKPFDYQDFHCGLGVLYRTPEDKAIRRAFGGQASACGTLGFCFGLFRTEVGGSYGIVKTKESEAPPLNLLDSELEPAEVNMVELFSAQSDVCLTLPISRSLRGKGTYPFGGVGYGYDWYSVMRSNLVKDRAFSEYPYFLVGVTIGGLCMEYRQSPIVGDRRWRSVAVCYRGVFVL